MDVKNWLTYLFQKKIKSHLISIISFLMICSIFFGIFADNCQKELGELYFEKQQQDLKYLERRDVIFLAIVVQEIENYSKIEPLDGSAYLISTSEKFKNMSYEQGRNLSLLNQNIKKISVDIESKKKSCNSRYHISQYFLWIALILSLFQLKEGPFI